MQKPQIMVMDPDVAWTLTVSDALIQSGREVLSANSVSDAMLLLNAHRVEVVILEPEMAEPDPLSLVEQLRQLYPKTALIVCTRRPSISQAVQTTKLGVHDYVAKTDKAEDVRVLQEKIAQIAQEQILSDASDPVQRGVLGAPTHGFYGIISQDPQMSDIFELIQTIADSSANVLIEGETGTGKELVARAIHEASSRHGKPFITLDCSALARELLESELFGHEKGAFTGAVERHIGRFERANGGTLLLDEVANMDVAVQAKLLRVLQTRTFERVGGQKFILVDVRIVAATNRSLADRVKDGSFREDLYHRLNVVQIDVPPLRRRAADIPLLATEFLRRFARQNHKNLRGFTDAAIKTLCIYRWPGNVRELENVMLQAAVLAKSPLIDLSDLPKRILQAVPDDGGTSNRLAERLEEPEKRILLETLRQHGGNCKRAAEALQISRTTLYTKLKKHQIDPDVLR